METTDLTQQEVGTADPSKIRVLIADDVPCMRESLRTVLSLDPSLEIVGEAADGAEAVKLAAHLHPDVVLVDLEMPCCDGYVCTQELTERNLCGSVVVLSIHSDSASRARARAAGAHVFLPKGTPMGPLVNAIQCAAGRTVPAQPPMPVTDRPRRARPLHLPPPGFSVSSVASLNTAPAPPK